MTNDNGNNQIVVRSSSSPFRDSFMSTIGGGFGVFVLAGIPVLFIGGVLFFIGWKVYRSITESKNIQKESSQKEIVVNSVSGVNEEIEIKFLSESKRSRYSKSNRTSARIVK